MNSGAQPAERMIRDIIECEHSYINTDHADFIGGSRAIAQVSGSPVAPHVRGLLQPLLLCIFRSVGVGFITVAQTAEMMSKTWPGRLLRWASSSACRLHCR